MPHTFKKIWNGRLLLYVGGFAVAAILDGPTPLGVADWLIELVLVWVAVTWGGPFEMVVVAGTAMLTMLAGLWTSPAEVPFWVGVLNRVVCIAIIWAMVHVARKGRLAEAARAAAAAEIKVLEGLLPICGGCKAIRAPAGDWHSLESYVTSHSEASFSHTYCPDCIGKYFPEEAAEAAEADTIRYNRPE